MPYWSIAEWRACIGSSWCALGRPHKIKTSIRYGARVVKKELTLNRVMAMLILLILLIGVNIGLRTSVEEGHHHQLMSLFAELIQIFFEKAGSLNMKFMILTTILMTFIYPSAKRSQRQSVSCGGICDFSYSAGLLLYVMFLILKMVYPAMNLVYWLIPAAMMIHALDVQRALSIPPMLSGSTVKTRILRNGLCLPKCVLDVAVSIAASVIVSLLLLSGDIEQNPGPLGDLDYNSVDANQTLSEDDLTNVLKAVLPIKSVYFSLGQCLGLLIAVLESIGKAESDTERALYEMLKLWLQQKYDAERFGLPTWRMLVEAVDKEAGGNNNELAKKIASNHRTIIQMVDCLISLSVLWRALANKQDLVEKLLYIDTKVEIVIMAKLQGTWVLAVAKAVLDVALSVAASVILSLLLISGDVEENPGPVGDLDYKSIDDSQILNEDDLAYIMEEVLDIKSMYFTLGRSLRLQNDDMETICKHYPNESDHERALNDVLLLWLKKEYNVERFGPPTWRMLVEAVNKRSGGNNYELVKQIALNHPAAGNLTASLQEEIKQRACDTEESDADVLNINNIKEMLDEMWDYRFRWKSIGIELHVDTGTLDAIEKDCKTVHHCLLEMIKYWLRNSPRPTKEIIRVALQSKLVSNAAGVINMEHYEAYEEALKGGLSLTLRYLKFLFFGPPRSGKSSTRRRLIKEIVNLRELGVPSVSTGVVETNDVIIKTSKPEDVTIKKLTSESVAIAGSEWKTMKSSKESTQQGMYDEKDLAQLFYQLIYKQSTSTTPATSSELIPMQDSNKHSKSEAPDPSNPAIFPTSTNNPTGENTKQDEQSDDVAKLERLSDTEKSEINDAFKNLTTILQSDSPEDLKQLLEDLTMINMADVGGQPAFLDMLPALTIGPALYLLFFRLNQDLQTPYPVRFLQHEKGEEVVLETSYCIEEVLYQCLASIACFSSHSQSDAKVASKSTASSRALLFGTYKDEVDDEKISQIQGTLEDKFKDTKLYKKGLLLKTLKNKMAFTVDNMKGTEDSEMADIRKDIEGKIEEYFPAIPIPASWLMFRIVVNLLNKPVLSLTQCEEIAMRLSMPTSVKEAIWFFHHDIGSLMHYSNIPSMKDTVICHPQVIFDSISKLIIDKFQKASRSITAGEIEQFHQRGLFTLSHIQDTTEHPQSSLLELNQLVDVLKHHNVLAEVKQENTQSEPKFIMPAVMKYASESELLSPTSTLEAMPSPIFIHFAGGFVPFGVFCAGVARLIAQLDSMSPGWQLCDDQLMRNKAKFIIDKAFFATLISRPQYIMIHIEKHQKARCKIALEVICSKVRKTVVQALETVILNMKYKPYGTLQVSIEQPFELAFTCNLEDSHSDHFMIVTKDDSGHHTECRKSRVGFDLEDRHLIWFKDENGTSSSTTDVQPECAHNEDEQNIINSGPHSEPLASSSTPNDQHSTVPEADVAPATHNLTFSSSMSDKDFFKWLNSKGVNDKDCKSLTESGITPSGFLQFDVKDFDDIGLTKFGKKLFLKIFTEVKGQYGDQQPSERDYSHDGSRGHAPQHSGQMDGSNEGTVNDGGGGSAHGSSRAASAVNTMSDNPPTLPAMLKILLPVSKDWMNIGTMLSLSQGRLTAIETRCNSVRNDCLREMLNDWLQQTNPRPTKSALVDVIEMYNPSLAEKISAL